MKENKIRICLLGGSNSILACGLKRGLNSRAHLTNLAVGATTSLQNIYAMTRDHTHIVQNVDAIVTESNVNDAHAIHNGDIPILTIEANIRKLYREIGLTGKPAVAILIPIVRFREPLVGQEIIDKIYGYHLKYTKMYGIDVVNLVQALSEYTPAHKDANLIMTHHFHPVESYMYELGLNIATHLNDTAASTTGQLFQPNFSTILPADLPGQCYEKFNSGFRRQVMKIQEPLSIDITDGTCVGISTWSDGPSELILASDDVTITKQFSTDLLFNEFMQIVRGPISLSSNIGKTKGCTERSLNTRPNTEILTHPVILAGLLIEKDNSNEPQKCRDATVLDNVLPPIDVHIRSVQRALNFIEIMPEFEVTQLRKAAAICEKRSPKLAHNLMQIVSKHRPFNPVYQLALTEYKARIKKKKRKSILGFFSKMNKLLFTR